MTAGPKPDDASETVAQRLVSFAAGCLGTTTPAKTGSRLGVMGSVSEAELQEILCHIEVLAKQRAAGIVGRPPSPERGSEEFMKALGEACGVDADRIHLYLPKDPMGKVDLIQMFRMDGKASPRPSEGITEFVDCPSDLPRCVFEGLELAEEVDEGEWLKDAAAINSLRSAICNQELPEVPVAWLLSLARRCRSRRPALCKTALRALAELADRGGPCIPAAREIVSACLAAMQLTKVAAKVAEETLQAVCRRLEEAEAATLQILAASEAKHPVCAVALLRAMAWLYTPTFQSYGASPHSPCLGSESPRRLYEPARPPGPDLTPTHLKQPMRPEAMGMRPGTEAAAPQAAQAAQATGWQLSSQAASFVRHRQRFVQYMQSESLFAMPMPSIFRPQVLRSPGGVSAVPRKLSPSKENQDEDVCDEGSPWLDLQKGLASTWQSLMTSMDALSGNWCMYDDGDFGAKRRMRLGLSVSEFDDLWFVRTSPTIRPDTPGGQPSPCVAAAPLGVDVRPVQSVQVAQGVQSAQQGPPLKALPLAQVNQILRVSRSSIVSLKGNKSTAPNQDRAALASLGGADLLTVCDGHGEVGHDVAEICIEVLPRLVLQQVSKLENNMSPAGVPGKESRNPQEAAAAVGDVWREATCQAFEEMHRMLEALTADEASQLDARSSGTTATVLALTDRRILVAHVGDSRAVLGVRRGGEWIPRDLTRDHKPEAPEERARIEQSGAQVITVGQPPNSTCRVYSPQQAWPSINMSRSLGDLHAHTQGLSAEAEVNCFERSDTTEAVIIVGSDGIWDVMDSNTAVNLAWQSFQQGADPALALSQEAYLRWNHRALQAGYTDDITVVVRFL
ncbi:unnamed protein product [Effrenium voratum]|nr:unnamed protein product [Effrenium voratum]